MRPSWLLPALALLALTAAGPAQACATCGCGDPTLLSIGVEQPFGGRVRAFSEGQYRTESSGTPQTGGTALAEWALNLGGSYAFSSRWALSLTVLGSDIQAGPGAWWFIGGVSYYARLGGPWSAYASVLAYLPTKGREGLEPAPTGRATVYGQAQPWPWLSIRLGTDMRLDGVWHENGVVSPDTGGFIAFLSPAVLLSPATDWVIQLAARIPVINALEGAHTEGTSASISLVVDL